MGRELDAEVAEKEWEAAKASCFGCRGALTGFCSERELLAGRWIHREEFAKGMYVNCTALAALRAVAPEGE